MLWLRSQGIPSYLDANRTMPWCKTVFGAEACAILPGGVGRPRASAEPKARQNSDSAGPAGGRPQACGRCGCLGRGEATQQRDTNRLDPPTNFGPEDDQPTPRSHGGKTAAMFLLPLLSASVSAHAKRGPGVGGTTGRHKQFGLSLADARTACSTCQPLRGPGVGSSS